MPFIRKRKLTHGSTAVTRAVWTVEGRYVMTCGNDKTLRLWNPLRPASEEPMVDSRGEPEEALQIKSYAGPHSHEITDCAIATDNSTFASCGGDRNVFLWDVTHGTVLRRFEGHTQRVNAVCFAGGAGGASSAQGSGSSGSGSGGDDSVLITASYDQTVRLWDVRARQSRDPIQTLGEFKDSVTGVVASGWEVVTSCVDGCVRVHDLRTGQCHADALNLGGAGGKVPLTSVALSHDKRCILTSAMTGIPSGVGMGDGGGCAVLLDRGSGTALQSYRGHTHSSYALNSCFSHDDAYVVSGSEDGAVLVWGLVEGEVLQRLEHNGGDCFVPKAQDENSGTATLPGSDGISTITKVVNRTEDSCSQKAVMGVAVHPRDSRIVSTSQDGTAIYWEGTYP